jgi:hypothetical protein
MLRSRPGRLLMLACTALACGSVHSAPPSTRPTVVELPQREDIPVREPEPGDTPPASPKVAFGLSIYFDNGEVAGCVVNHVFQGTPAERAGFETGDLITFVESKRIKTAKDWSNATARLQPGEEVRVTVRRSINAPGRARKYGTKVILVTPVPHAEIEGLKAAAAAAAARDPQRQQMMLKQLREASAEPPPPAKP